MQLTMKDVMTANCQISNEVMLTSNHCAALARELNALLDAAPVPPQDDAQPVAGQSRFTSQKDWQPCSYEHHLMVIANPGEWPGYETRALYTRSDAGEVDRLNTVIDQQKSLIASLRAELRESYSIDAAVQEEHLDLDAAAKKLAACMDYPWEHMPEQGRASMREHATAVIGAALNPVKSGASA